MKSVLRNLLKLLMISALMLSVSQASSVDRKIEKVLNNTMTITMEKFLSLTNYLERHKYIYRHDAREILATFNTRDKVDVERLNEFGATIDSLREEISNNPRVKIDVKERVETQVNEILTMIQLSINKKEAIYRDLKVKQQIAAADRKLANAKKTREAETRVVIKKEKVKTIAPYVMGGVLLVTILGFMLDRRRQAGKVRKLKKNLSVSLKKAKKIESSISLKRSFVDVVERIDTPVAIVVDLKGNVLGSSGAFGELFEKYFDEKNDNWDNFFEDNFYLSKTNDKFEGVYKFRKNKFLNFFVTSQLVKDENVRFLTFRVVDSNELISIKEQDQKRLEHGASSVGDIFERALTNYSKIYELGNISIDKKSFDSEITTYSNSENLESMIYKNLQFLNTYDSTTKGDQQILVKVLRSDGVLKISSYITTNDFSIDSNSKVRDGIRELSKDVAQYDGEFRVLKETVRGRTNIVFELNIYDFDVAFDNNISAMVENETIN